ncbi:MAG: hypothetical protein RLY31_1072 [Bacteroidota bacterium]
MYQRIRLATTCRRTISAAFLAFWLLLSSSAYAEGSKDFVNYPGYRLFLDTRDPQQLKVFASAGEFIQVGASHTGLQGGFIQVYRPDGSLAVTYDNTGTTAGQAIIFNDVQEAEGPTGGGSIQGSGYVPGIVPVDSGDAGVWTVVFDYPGYINASFLNILNNAPWTRAQNQPNAQRVVLAWDVTVSQDAPANEGGNIQEGRLYTNEHISIINNNGVTTSPVFYVLTQDGYLYQVNIDQADPFRFPISSNSLGLVDGTGNPIYQSKPRDAFVRSDDVATWQPGGTYLYEPQAADEGPLINNKIFFNIPDPDMPLLAPVTDIYRNNTHQTWLYRTIEPLEIYDFAFVGANPNGDPCAPGNLGFGNGGWFVIQTNLGGNMILQLDLNNNGEYDDPEDLVLSQSIQEGVDSIFWDGDNGLGVTMPIQDSLPVILRGSLRYGELHIALTDVESNPGGVTFQWLNPFPGLPDSLFYYDHTDVGGPISFPAGGSPIPGMPQPTATPYTFSNGEGNDNYLDQWFFIEGEIEEDTIFVNVVENCVCDLASPVLTHQPDPAIGCTDRPLSLTAFNEWPGLVEPIAYAWSGPTGLLSTDTIAPSDTSTLVLPPLSLGDSGAFQVVATTVTSGCADTLSFDLTVFLTPAPAFLAPPSEVCEGGELLLQATDLSAGSGPFFFSLVGPVLQASGQANGGDTLSFSLPTAGPADGGTYSLVLSSTDGCVSDTALAAVTIAPTPVLQGLSTGSTVCDQADVSFSAVNSNAAVGDMVCVWSGPNGFSTTSQPLAGTDTVRLQLTNVNASFAGTYSVTCLVGACASTPLTFELTLAPSPVATALQADQTCEGDTLLLSAANPVPLDSMVTYTWTGPNPAQPILPFTATSPSQGPFSLALPGLSPADAGSYCLQLSSSSGCLSATECIDVTVDPLPAVSLPAAFVACPDDPAVLTAFVSGTNGSPFQFDWSLGSTVVASGVQVGDTVSLAIASVDGAATGTYILTVRSLVTGCVGAAATLLTAHPAVTVSSLSGGGAYCPGTPVQLEALPDSVGIGWTYHWNGPGGISYGPFLTDGNLPLVLDLPTLDSSLVGTYVFQLTSSDGCTNDPVSLDLALLPSASLSSLTPAGPLCSGDSTLVCAVGDAGTAGDSVFLHLLLPDGTTAVFPGLSGEEICFSYVTPGILCAWLVSADGCGSDTLCTNFDFQPNPLPSVATGALEFCEGDTLFLDGTNNAVGSGNLSYTWFQPDGSVLTTGTAPWNGPFPAVLPDVSPAAAGEYTLSLTAGDCGNGAAPVSVIIHPLPQTELAVQGPAVLCVGSDSFTVLATVGLNGAGSLDWTLVGAGLNDSGTLVQDSVLTWQQPATGASIGTILLSVTSDQGCTFSVTSAPLAMLEVLSPPLETPPGVLCLEDDWLLSVGEAYPAGTIFSWMLDGQVLASGPVPQWLLEAPVVAGDYSVTATLDGCSATSVPLALSPAPVPLATDDSYSAPSSQAQEGNVLDNDLLAGPAALTIVSPPANGSVSIADDGSFLYTPAGVFVTLDEFQYQACLLDCPDQCASAWVTVEFDVDCVVPNILTPNGDDANDILHVACLENDRFPDNRLRVFNRWGGEIVIFEPYANDWDVTFGEDKKPVPAGTYFFILELDKNAGNAGGENVLSGYVKVVR